MSTANSNLERIREPLVKRLPKARLEVERWFKIKDRKLGRKLDLTLEIFGGYGLLDGTVDGSIHEVKLNYPNDNFTDCRLIDERTEEIFLPSGETIFQLYQKYQTLTATWALEDEDQVSSTANGLRVLRKVEVAVRGTALPYDEDDIGVSTLSNGGKTLTLAGFEDDGDDRRGRVISQWAEPGVLSVRTPLVGGQQQVVVSAIGLDQASVTSALADVTVNHVLINRATGNYEGFQTTDYTFEVDDFDILSATENGLKLLTQTQLSVTNFSRGVIGTDTNAADVTLYLAGEEIDNGNTIKRRVSRWAEPGVLSRNISTRNNGALIIETVEAFAEVPTANTGGAVQIGNQVSSVEGIPTRRYTFALGSGQIQSSTRPGRIPGTTEVTVSALGTAVVPPGVLIAEDDIEEDGYIRYVRTSISGTITGTKLTYTDVIKVMTPGVVILGTIETTVALLSGTQAVIDVDPPRNKNVAATVTLEILTTPPNTAALAYDLGNLSCSVVSRQVAFSSRGTDLFTTKSGNSRIKSERLSASMSARITHYPNCYISGSTSAEGTFTYTAAKSLANPDAENGIALDNHDSTTKTFLNGNGATSASGYATTGIIQRRSRPVLTALDGTIYYEVVTWSV